MQRFSCPFCGPRDETEFLFGAEAGKERPEPAAAVSQARWADYLYANDNLKGRSREVWTHLTCGEFFVMERDTVTHEVFAVSSLREEGR